MGQESRITSLAAATSSAGRAALHNWRANLRALARSQAAVAQRIAGDGIPADWTFARDGCLSVRDEGGRWLANCSLPRRACDAIFRALQLTGVTGCLLAPNHGAQIAAALARIRRDQAIIVIAPEEADLLVALHCCDFAEELDAHRLFFAAGANWTAEMLNLFAEYPGLPTPTQFIRTPLLAEDLASRLMGPAQQIFADENKRRGELAQKCRARPHHKRGGRAAVIASSQFSLWGDAGAVLGELAAAAFTSVARLDPSDPASTSHLALAQAAGDADALLVVDAFRSDLPQVLSPDIPVVTWVTSPRVAPHGTAGANDGILLADEGWAKLAADQAWPMNRMALAGWPVADLRSAEAEGEQRHLAIITDTVDVSSESRHFELSSHRLLWDAIVEELARDPFALPADIGQYLAAHAARLGIAPAALNANLFVNELIVPAYQQALARLLLSASIPLKLHGCGWRELKEFAFHAAGPVRWRVQLLSAAAEASALVHVWPLTHAHPIDALGRRVVRRGSSRRDAFLAMAHGALHSPGRPLEPSHSLSPALLAQFVASLC